MEQTATETNHQMSQIESIANGDFLEQLSAIMPYLRERREAARVLTERYGIGGYEYLQQFNKSIKEIMNLF